MAALNTNALTRISTTASVDMKTAGNTTLVTVPAGKSFVPICVIIRNNSASLAGGTSYSFGTLSAASDWRQTVDLSGMTTASTTSRVLYATDNTTYTVVTAGSTWGIKVTTGSTAACTATIDVFGYLF